MARMCIANNQWKESNPELVISLSKALELAGYRMRFSTISPDFIFNHSGISVAFIVVLSSQQLLTPRAWDRLAKMDSNFQRSYFLTPVCFEDKFFDLFFRYRRRPWKPILHPILDWENALATMLKMVYIHAERKHQDTVSISPAVVEKLEFVSSPEAVTHALCAIPGLEVHDAHSLMYGIGSIEAVSQSNTDSILKLTDLSKEKARGVEEFFGNEIYNRNPVLD